ncbi:MAG: polyprenyl synthetase family protein [Candidatus Microsaccharimonas sp.]
MNDSRLTKTHQKIPSPMGIGEAKSLIDTYISQLLDERIRKARQVSPHYEALWQAINNLYQAGGKRLRPYMTLLTYTAFGGEQATNILPAAAAQELLHQAMLIHDDIIDRDTIRYNVKNITGQFEDVYKGFLKETTERRHFAESVAILAGDLLISEAHLQVSKVDADIQWILSDAMFHVIGGELLDTEASFRIPNDIDPLMIATQKTASYSFVGPLVMGATLAKASDEQISLLRDIGNTVGIAFQQRDDIIGVFGDEMATGKSSDGDIREGKQTLLINEFYKRANNDQKAQFDNVFGHQTSTKAQIERSKMLLIETGTKAVIESSISRYQSIVIKQILRLDINNEYRDMFVDLVNKSLERDS